MIRPINGNILVKPQTAEPITKSGLYVPADKKDNTRAEVLAVSDSYTEQGTVLPSPVEVGNVILLSKYGGTEIEIDGEKLLLVKATDILGVVG